MTIPAKPNNAPKHILVVEDDMDVRFLLAAELEQHGYSVEQAANGLEALNAITTARPHVILLDMRMPVMDGWHFVTELRSRFGRVAPIVVMTAAADPRARAREVGADAWLAKPFELVDVLAAVKKLLG